MKNHSNKPKFKKYYINLDRSTKRKLFMQENYDNITRISAYDGKKLDTYDDIILPKNSQENKYQLGASLSHITLLGF